MGTGHRFPDMSLRYILLIPLSRVLTYTRFGISIIWFLFTYPLRAFLHFYEQRIRAQFPQLPSIQRFLFRVSKYLNTLAAIVVPHVPQGSQDTANLPSLYVDIDAIKAGKS